MDKIVAIVHDLDDDWQDDEEDWDEDYDLRCDVCYEPMEKAFCYAFAKPLCKEHCNCEDKVNGDGEISVTMTLHHYARTMVEW